MIALKHTTGCLKKLLNFDNPDLSKSPKWKSLRGALRVYLDAFSQLIRRLVDTESRFMILQHLYTITPVLTSFPRSTKPLIDRFIKIWAHYPKSAENSNDPDSINNKLRIIAYLILNKLSNKQKGRLVLAEYIAKNMYKQFQRSIRQTSVHTLPVIDFLKRTLAEIFTSELILESGLAYKHAFLYIRNLAMTLRKAITTQKHLEVYNWNFVHSVQLWTGVVNKTSELEKLQFPITQITIGAIRLDRNIKNVPFIYWMCGCLVNSVEKTRKMIPVHVMLFDMVLLVDRTVDDGLEKKLIVKMARKSKKDEEELNTHDMEKAWPCMLRFSKNELKHEVVLGKFLADKFFILYSRYLKSQVNFKGVKKFSQFIY